MARVGLFPKAEDAFFLKLRFLFVGKRYKYLIGRGLHKKFVALIAENPAHELCHFYGVAAYFHIEVVREERFELNAEKSALGNKRTVLFDDGQKVLRCFASRKNH